MQMGAAGDGPDFAIAERPSNGNLGKGLPAGAHIPIPLAIEPLAPAQAGKHQGGQWRWLLQALTLQQLAQFLAGGGAIPQLELHLLAGPHALGHGHGPIAGVDADQVAHQEGTAVAGLAGCQVEAAAPDAQEEGVFGQFPFIGAEAGEDRLQGGHRAVALAAFAHLQHHIALGLLHFEHRADGTATLGHQGIQAPAAAN